MNKMNRPAAGVTITAPLKIIRVAQLNVGNFSQTAEQEEYIIQHIYGKFSHRSITAMAHC